MTASVAREDEYSLISARIGIRPLLWMRVVAWSPPIAVFLAAQIATPMWAQEGRADPPSMSSSWLQLGNGIDNAGVVSGSFSTRWQYRASTPVRGISVAAGVVVLGTESADAEGEPKLLNQHGSVTALDAASGRVLWSRPLPSWVHGDPVIYDGLAFVTYGRWPMTSAGGIAAFRLSDGVRVWSIRTTTGNMAASALDTVTRSLFVAGGDGVLFRISPTDGRVLKQTGLRAPDAMSGPRVLGDGNVVLGAGNVVVSYSALGDSVRWRFHPALLHSIGDIPVAATGRLIFTTGTKNFGFRNAFHVLPASRFFRLVVEAVRTKHFRNYRSWFQQQWLVALDRGSGRHAWRKALGVGLEVPRNTAGTPVVSGTRVIISSPVSKQVVAFDVHSGTMLWSREIRSGHKGPVTVIGADILVGDRLGILHLLRATDGAELGQCDAGGGFTPTNPILVGLTFIAATRDGWVHAAPYVEVRQQMLTAHGAKCFLLPSLLTIRRSS